MNGKTLLEYLRGEPRKLALFGAILLFGLASKLVRLETPGGFYFDEVYHAYTAGLYLHSDQRSYDPWGKADQERGIEWTHPPLAKLVMAANMKLFGERPMAWRIGSVVFGTGATVAAAVLAYDLFQSGTIALLTLLLMTMENLTFTQSRIGMNDMYLVFFMLLTWIHYVRWRHSDRTRHLYLAGIGLGAAAATKWTALWVLGVMLLDLARDVIWRGRQPRLSEWFHLLIALVGLPVLLYIASYAHFFALGGTWEGLWKLQAEMWRYHSNLTATHDYSSVPWQWVLNLRPVWYHVDYSIPGKVGNIYNLGNSVILLAGLYAALHALFKEAKGSWTWEKWFVLICYFGVWLPWSFSPRVMLFYHYVPAIPALCILLARKLNMMLQDSRESVRRNARLVLAGAFVWWVIFYPNSTEIRVPASVADTLYRGIPGWK